MARLSQVGAASRAVQRLPRLGRPTAHGFTLVEMLVAMAITLVMMAAVTTLFANISGSVRNRRATIEMTNQMRHLRKVLQQDLQGATCPGLTWQRPESNHGYIEIIEGQYRDSFPSQLTDGVNDPTAMPPNPELIAATSTIPRNNGAVDSNGNGRIDANEWEAHYQDPTGSSFVATVGSGPNTLHVGASGLGDYDDILMLTVRNENEPFVGRAPGDMLNGGNTAKSFRDWSSQTLQSTLAEVVWFAIENPDADNDADRFFGEPGMRTIYRRTLLIAPWVNPYLEVANASTGMFTEPSSNGGRSFQAEPGLVRILRLDKIEDITEALAALTAFQDRYDLSVRVEWDTNLQRWKIMANTLGDLTKRENRFGHFGYQFIKSGTLKPERRFPYPMVSTGRGYAGNNPDVKFVADPEIGGPTDDAKATANTFSAPAPLGRIVASYTIDAMQNLNNPNARYAVRPFAYIDEDSGFINKDNGTAATAQAMLNDNGEVVRVIHGPVPLWGSRRGEDVMLTNALAFDLRVYDPGAPIFMHKDSETIVEPCDAGWSFAYLSSDNMGTATPAIGTTGNVFPYSGQGAYVDLGYGFNPFSTTSPGLMAYPRYATGFASAALPWFFTNNGLSNVFGNLLAPGYSVYDTWSFHYENNGRSEDGGPLIDEAIDGLDEPDFRTTAPFDALNPTDYAINGPDDIGERETAPPYDKPLRGVQVLVRGYELDSRAIRQVRVSQHFMPE